MEQSVSCKLSIDCEVIDYQCLCSKNSLFELLGTKWTPEIITILGHHPKLRYKEINQHLANISPTVLTTRLKELEASNYVKRTKYQESPPRVDYSLTSEGITVWEKLQILLED